MMKKSALLLALVFVSSSLYAADPSPAPVVAKGKAFSVTQGKVEFHAVGHPSAIKIVGKGEVLSGAFTIVDSKVTGSAVFQMESLKTGIEMRDHHMKEKYLEVGKFPQSKLTVTDLTVAASPDLPKDAIPFKGTLSLHGIEHAVAGTVKLNKNAEQISFDAQFAVKIADYGITVPTFAGITVADDVDVEVTGDVAPAK